MVNVRDIHSDAVITGLPSSGPQPNSIRGDGRQHQDLGPQQCAYGTNPILTCNSCLRRLISVLSAPESRFCCCCVEVTATLDQSEVWDCAEKAFPTAYLTEPIYSASKVSGAASAGRVSSSDHTMPHIRMIRNLQLNMEEAILLPCRIY